MLSSLYILLLFIFSITLFNAALNSYHVALAIEPIQYALITSWGEGELTTPENIALDSSGNLYVIDSALNGYLEEFHADRVQKFSPDGTFIKVLYSEDTESAQVNTPNDIAIDSSDNVYMVDGFKHEIRRITADGEFITAWGSEGSGVGGVFLSPWAIAIDSADNVYVVDKGNHRIQKFDSDGMFITKWGSEGTGNGQFSDPEDIAIDSANNVYVTDYEKSQVQKFTADGTFITSWGSKAALDGGGNGRFYGMSDIEIDSSDNVYVVDRIAEDIQRFDSRGNFITRWESELPYGIAMDSSGHVYVTNGYDSRIQVYATTQ
jgi:tripartite motif-containing protein 71